MTEKLPLSFFKSYEKLLPNEDSSNVTGYATDYTGHLSGDDIIIRLENIIENVSFVLNFFYPISSKYSFIHLNNSLWASSKLTPSSCAPANVIWPPPPSFSIIT